MLRGSTNLPHPRNILSSQDYQALHPTALNNSQGNIKLTAYGGLTQEELHTRLNDTAPLIHSNAPGAYAT